MISIKTRIFIITSCAIGLVGGFGYLTADSARQYAMAYKGFTQSLNDVKYVKQLNIDKVTRKQLQQLNDLRNSYDQPGRKLAMSNLIKSLQEKKAYQAKKDIRYFERNEEVVRGFYKATTNYLEKRIVYYSIIALASVLFCLAFIYFYISKRVFSPLNALSRKMIDFLNNKYSYEFTVPENTEIGHLHATFNSLAQRVLGNMEELKSLDKAKSEFLSIASHELRTPLTSIKGSLGLLNSGVVGNFDDSATNLISIAEGESDRLIRLINDLLDLAKIEARKLPLKKDWIDLSEVFTLSAQGIHGLAQSAQVKIDIEGGEYCSIFADKDRVQQVITNLLSNAIKYSPSGGTVTLSCTNHDDHLVIEVKDQGPGIAPEDQELIFQQFRQATGPDNPLVKGTGLGLAIAKALVEQHQGEIGVRSTPGKGSCFYFTLVNWKLATNSREDMNIRSVA